MLLSILVVLGLLSQQSAPVPAPAHCKLTRVSDRWQGTCAGLFGETPTLTVSSTPSLKSGRYQQSIEPKAIYAGDMKMPTGAVPVEIEIYEGGTGILRPQGLTWLVVANAVTRSDVMEFTLDVTKTVPPSDLDREIITRAASILKSEAVWDRADDRQCGADDKTWSIYCAMIRATNEVTGGIHHRRPAMEVVRQIVDARSAGRKYEHRLRDYNNDPSTTLADVRSLFEEALGRLKR
jgi:hypothetical protein